MLKHLKTTVAAALAAAALMPASALAGDPFSTGIDPGASSFTVARSTDQAGAHPDVAINFAFTGAPGGYTYGQPRTAEVELPAGLLGDPNVAAQCTRLQFVREVCPLAAQIGDVDVLMYGLFFAGVSKVNNLAPQPGRRRDSGCRSPACSRKSPSRCAAMATMASPALP